MERFSPENRSYLEYIGFTDALTVILVVLVLICGVTTYSYSRLKQSHYKIIQHETYWKEKYLAKDQEFQQLKKDKNEISLGDSLIKVFSDKNLNEKVLFESGSDIITDGYRKDLDDALNSLQQNLNGKPYDFVVVVGHTDNNPISNYTFKDNWDLGAARATAVVRYFTDHRRQNPIHPSQIASVSYGEFKPIDWSESATGKAQNRRIEIFLTEKRKFLTN